MKKRFLKIATLCMGLLATLGFVGCGTDEGSSEELSSEKASSETSSVAPESSEASSSESSEASSSEDASSEESSEASSSGHEHEYTTVVVEPTCTERGFTMYVCSCKDNYVTYVKALGHNYAVTYDWEGTVCTATGVCAIDPTHEIITETVTAEYEKDTDATCVKAETGHYVASFENKSFTTQATADGSVEKGEALPHDWAKGNCIDCKETQLIMELNEDHYMVSWVGDFQGTELVIPSTYKGFPVQGIESGAFFDCSGLTSIEIPNSVTSIGSSAFHGCSSLTSIEIPDGVTSIGIGTFSGCSQLTSIEIPDGVTSIGDGAFASCRELTSIEIPNSVTSIGDSVFLDCSSLTSITFNGTVAEWGAIKKVFDWNFGMPATEVVCSDGRVGL